MGHPCFGPCSLAAEDALESGRARTYYVRSRDSLEARANIVNAISAETPLTAVERTMVAAARGRTLDLGAGHGHVSLALQQAGLAVTAVDIDPRAVALLSKTGLLDVRAGDARALPDERWDTILLGGHGLGMCGRLAEVVPFLAHLESRLTERGVVIVHSSNGYALPPTRRRAVAQTWESLLSGATRYPGECEIWLEYQDWVGQPFAWLWLDYDLLRHAAAQARFDVALAGEVDDEYVAILTRRP